MAVFYDSGTVLSPSSSWHFNYVLRILPLKRMSLVSSRSRLVLWVLDLVALPLEQCGEAD